MAEVARIRWTTPAPTSVDEELVVYDDAEARLVVRTSRDGQPVTGTFAASLEPAELEALTGAYREIQLLRIEPDQVTSAAEEVAARARTAPVATATFHAGLVPGGGVCLLCVGAGKEPVRFELDPDSVVLHLEAGGTEISWHELDQLGTGFVSPALEGLGGVGRAAEIAPENFGAIALQEIPLGDADAVAVQVAGVLYEALRDGPSYQRFTVRTATAPTTLR